MLPPLLILLLQKVAREKEQMRASARRNRVNRLECTRRWRSKNADKIREYNQEYRKSHKGEHVEEARQRAAAWYAANKERARKSNAEWASRNPEALERHRKKWAANNPEKIKAMSFAWRVKNRRVVQEKTNARYRNCPSVRILSVQRARLRHALNGRLKAAKTVELLGCDGEALKRHLEKQFVFGMTWENYGSRWHIDHIKPCAAFDFTDPAQQRECFHFSNLQPLWAEDNQKKGGRYFHRGLSV
jgi:hypothetical protein